MNFRTVGKKGTGNGQFNSPRGICIGPRGNDILVCDYGNHRVQVLNSIGKFVCTLGSNHKGLSSPTCICASESKIFAYDSGHKRIQTYNQNYEYLSFISIPGNHFGSSSPRDFGSSSPRDIGILRNGNIVINDGYEILVLNQRGHIMKRLWLYDDTSIGTIMHCNTSTSEIIVAQGRRVQILDQNLNRLNYFGTHFEVTGLCTDQENNILVTIKESGVCIYKRTGDFTGHAYNGNGPIGICSLGRKIITTNGSNTISISRRKVKAWVVYRPKGRYNYQI